MSFKKKRKRASRMQGGKLMFPSTVMFEVEQYNKIKTMHIPGVRDSFGAKVRHLLELGLTARLAALEHGEAIGTVQARMDAEKKLKKGG